MMTRAHSSLTAPRWDTMGAVTDEEAATGTPFRSVHGIHSPMGETDELDVKIWNTNSLLRPI